MSAIYKELRVLVGIDEYDDWQADVADEDWASSSGFFWKDGTAPRRLFVRVPVPTEAPIVEIVLPEIEETKVEAA